MRHNRLLQSNTCDVITLPEFEIRANTTLKDDGKSTSLGLILHRDMRYLPTNHFFYYYIEALSTRSGHCSSLEYMIAVDNVVLGKMDVTRVSLQVNEATGTHTSSQCWPPPPGGGDGGYGPPHIRWTASTGPE